MPQVCPKIRHGLVAGECHWPRNAEKLAQNKSAEIIWIVLAGEISAVVNDRRKSAPNHKHCDNTCNIRVVGFHQFIERIPKEISASSRARVAFNIGRMSIVKFPSERSLGPIPDSELSDHNHNEHDDHVVITME
jgi:hypothetical protein